MKATEHFKRSRLAEDRKGIELEWIEHVIANLRASSCSQMDAFDVGAPCLN